MTRTIAATMAVLALTACGGAGEGEAGAPAPASVPDPGARAAPRVEGPQASTLPPSFKGREPDASVFSASPATREFAARASECAARRLGMDHARSTREQRERFAAEVERVMKGMRENRTGLPADDGCRPD